LATEVSEDPEIAEDSSPVQQLYKGKKAVVVGAGPAGLVAAAYLARHGFSVKVFEGQKDIRSSPVSGQRAYNIGLSGATAGVLSDLGVELPPPDGGYKNGMHAFRGAFLLKPHGLSSQVPATTKDRVLGSRYSLTRAVLDVVEERFSANVDILFNRPCKDVSFNEQKAAFETIDGKEVVVDYDLLVAADGINSIVRKKLQEFDRSFKVQSDFFNPMYAGIEGLKVPDKSHALSESLKPGWVVFCRQTTKLATKHGVGFVFGPKPDGEVHGALFADSRFYSLVQGREEEYIDEIFSNLIPQDWKQRIVQQIKSGALSKLPTVAFVNRLDGPNTVLVGDAAHCVSPGMGFGCNMAITDGNALSDALDDSAGDISLVPQKFSSLRYETVRCYQLLEVGASDAKMKLGWMTIWRFFCQMHMVGHLLLRRVFSRHPLPVQFQILEGQISSKDAVAIIRREALLVSVVVFSALLLMVRHVVVPMTRFLVSRFPIL